MAAAPVPAVVASPLMSPGRKDLVTTGLGIGRVWATCGQGIPQEVYWPTAGEPQIRDLGFIVAGPDWWHEVKAQARYTVAIPDPDAPLASIVHTGPAAHPYQLTIEPVCDPDRDVVLIGWRLDGVPDAALYPMLASHLQTHAQQDPSSDFSGGSDNVGYLDGGALLATGGGRALCLAPDSGFTRSTVGYYGASDLWQDFDQHGAMQWDFDTAGPGPIVLGGQLPGSSGVLALGFGIDPVAASAAAAASLAAGLTSVRAACAAGWATWAAHTTLPAATPDDPPDLETALRWSATVVKTHQDRSGAVVAGLTTPWGDRGNDPGGYHLVWPRDAVEAGQALLALGHADDARSLLTYLLGQQKSDGSWHQNFYPDGTAYWGGVQIDETALPVLLAAALDEAGYPPAAAALPALRDALGFLVRTGPLTQQDRWEEDPGGSPFSLAITVAALVAGSKYLDGPDSAYALALADNWNERIEEWTYVAGSRLDTLFGVDGHYVRIGPSPAGPDLQIKNHSPGPLDVPYTGVLGMEFLYLARLGLRAADDARILSTLPIAEALLARDLGAGVAYYRYSFDGYGERIDGGNFDGATGIGRPWPLLAGERGHYAVTAGQDPLAHLQAMLAMRADTGLMPEQVWDSPPVPTNAATGAPTLPLSTAAPTLSATPLVWAHSELVKLAVARVTGAPVEQLSAVTDRYHASVPAPAVLYWRSQAPPERIASGRAIVVEDDQPFTLHYGHDGWQDVTDRAAVALPFGMYGAQLSAVELTGWQTIDFTRRYDRGWEGTDHQVGVDVTTPTFLRTHSFPALRRV